MHMFACRASLKEHKESRCFFVEWDESWGGARSRSSGVGFEGVHLSGVPDSVGESKLEIKSGWGGGGARGSVSPE